MKNGKAVSKLFSVLLCGLLLVAAAASCTDLSGVEERIDRLGERVDNLEEAVTSLRQAYDDGQLITSVEPFSADGATGWKVEFSNGEVITLLNGADAVTPLCEIDDEGFWTVSYDGGATFVRLTDGAGNALPARGEEGAAGKEGEEGVSVRVVVNAEGCYVVEYYRAAEPEVVLGSVPTEFRADAAAIVASIVKDGDSGVITLVMADGSSFCFGLDLVYPTGLVLLSREIVLERQGRATFEFRVNPSNADLNLDLSGEAQLFLDVVNAAARGVADSYVTAPTNYKLTKLLPAKNAAGETLQGQYTAYVLDLGVADEYCEDVVLVLSTKDGSGRDIQISSDLLRISKAPEPLFSSFSINGVKGSIGETHITVRLPYGSNLSALVPVFTSSGKRVTVNGKEQRSGETANNFSSPLEYVVEMADGSRQTFTVSIAFSNLPVVYVNTENGAPVTSKETWLTGSKMVIANAGTESLNYEEVSIRGRGNSTWSYPKKPYAVKLDKRTEVLGMPAHKRWVLLANWMDRTCMRNAVAFELGRCTDGLGWTPRGRFVDLILNGKFLGNYYLCEQIRIDENRVAIAEMTSADIDAASITGGYLLELDTYFDEPNKFRSVYGNSTDGQQGLPVNIKAPEDDVLVSQQFNYIRDYFLEAERALYASNFPADKSYRELIDINSFIDWWLVHELTGNGEPNHPKSSYMHKDRNGKLKAGPLWDFDWQTFKPYTEFRVKSSIWYGRFFRDPEFVAAVKQRWTEAEPRFRQVLGFIDRTKQEIQLSLEANCEQWPIYQNYNGDEQLSFDAAVASLRKCYEERLDWLDSQIKGM